MKNIFKKMLLFVSFVLLVGLTACKKNVEPEKTRPAEIDNGRDSAEGLKISVRNEKYGFVNENGNLAIGYNFDFATDFYENISVVTVDNQMGCINPRGKYIVELGVYDSISEFSDGLALVKKDGKYGYIDVTGKEVIPVKYRQAGEFSEGYAFTKSGNDEGYIDKNGKLVIKCVCQYGGVFSEGYAVIRTQNGYGLMNTEGKMAISCKYDYLSTVSKGLIIAKIDEKIGLVDVKGQVIVPFEYESIVLEDDGTYSCKGVSGDVHVYNEKGEKIENGGEN